jgi:hypothetical protein
VLHGFHHHYNIPYNMHMFFWHYIITLHRRVILLAPYNVSVLWLCTSGPVQNAQLVLIYLILVVSRLMASLQTKGGCHEDTQR